MIAQERPGLSTRATAQAFSNELKERWSAHSTSKALSGDGTSSQIIVWNRFKG
jgi:hypothetical protein